MRKFYSIILTALLALVSMSANAINVILNVDDPSRVNVKVGYGGSPLTLTAGDNTITASEYDYVYITAKDNAFITKVTKSVAGQEDSDVYVSNMTESYFCVYSSDEGAKWTVTTANADEVRDGQCTITVDDPTNVQVQRSGTYSNVELNAGDNTVKYITASELPLMIGAKNYGTQLYQVKVNNEVKAPQGTMWSITPANGDKVEIFANFPDEEVNVKFNYSTEEAEGVITSVSVNDENVTNYNDADFKVKLGKKVTINFNTTDYNLTSLKINGATQYPSNQIVFIVTEATTVDIDAHKYGTVKANLNIDNPDNIIVYRGYSYNNDIIKNLKAGDNEIEIVETNAMIQIKAVSGSFITSVTQNGEPVSKDYSDAYNITITDGMEIVVKTGTIERNSKAMVYIDSRAAASTYFNFERSDRYQVEIQTGYNEIKFYEGDNPFGCSWYGQSYSNVYLNNTIVNPLYEGSTTYNMTLADGDVVKIYLASNPSMLDATLTAAAGVDESKVNVTMDRITNVAAWSGKHSVLPGTEISIKPETGYDVTVKVDNVERSADADGAYVVNVMANTAIEISTASSGINDIEAAKTASSDVYNLQGVRIARNADIKQLPAGIYIVNGKKIIKN